MEAAGCWKCGQEPHDSLFCKFCNTLQPPAPDYYRFFGLNRRLSLEPEDLKQRYYRLSRLIHPDRFQKGTPNERRFSLDATAILNDAYRTLREPVLRAEYVLREEGLEKPPEKSKRVPPELLEEVFEVNEDLEELRAGDESAKAALQSSLARFRGLQCEIDNNLSSLFAEYDRGLSREVLLQVRNQLDRRSFISNLIEEVEEELGAH